MARKIIDKTNAVFLLLPWQTRQFCHAEGVSLPGNPVTAAKLRTVMKDTLYYSIGNFFVLKINHSLSEHYGGTFTSVTES